MVRLMLIRLRSRQVGFSHRGDNARFADTLLALVRDHTMLTFQERHELYRWLDHDGKNACGNT